MNKTISGQASAHNKGTRQRARFFFRDKLLFLCNQIFLSSETILSVVFSGTYIHIAPHARLIVNKKRQASFYGFRLERKLKNGEITSKIILFSFWA